MRNELIAGLLGLAMTFGALFYVVIKVTDAELKAALICTDNGLVPVRQALTDHIVCAQKGRP